METNLGPYRLEVATEFGPLITSLRRDDGPELLARLDPEVVLDYDGGQYRFRGGHRLWVSPEVPSVTYAADDHACAVTESDDRVEVSAPADGAGVIKCITIFADGDSLMVEHEVKTTDAAPSTLAPWAITQFPLGGTALLPLIGEDTAPSANRYLVMWPYSSVEDQRIELRDEVLMLAATDGPPLKFGSGPSTRSMGYFHDGYLFLNEIEPAHDRVVPDFGAGAQVYVGQGFCELESVGGLTDLANGTVATLTERWTVLPCDNLEEAVSAVSL